MTLKNRCSNAQCIHFLNSREYPKKKKMFSFPNILKNIFKELKGPASSFFLIMGLEFMISVTKQNG